MLPEIKVHLVLQVHQVAQVKQAVSGHLDFKDHEVILDPQGLMVERDLWDKPDKVDRKVHQEMLDQLDNRAHKVQEEILEVKEHQVP